MTTNRIIIGDDSELPDALDVSELIPVPPQTSGAAVDSRMRNRRIGVRRAAGHKRLILIGVILGVVLLAVAALAVLASPLFAIEDVRLSGAVYTSADDLAPILDGVDGQAILTVDTGSLREQIERLPWVRRAEVHTDFPRTLVVEIDERRPAAVYLGGDGRWRVVDREGRVIAVELGQPADYMAVQGVGPDLEAGGDAGPTYRALAELSETIRDLPELAAVVDHLTLSGAEEFGIVLNTDPPTTVNLGPATNLRNKLAVLITLQRDGVLEGAESVDVSDPAKPAVKN